ncbi:hypothetical protein C3L33_17662, partial [Rhododendron williamsianum]
AQADASDIRVAEDPEATDYSSSFDGTVSGTENCAEMSDAEVESCFGGDNGFPFDGFSSVFPMRKKKLTTHWRRFVRPLMWRCKWTELKIKQFQSQASKYSRELAAYDQKQLELDQLTSENFASKPLPFTVQSHGNKTMKRRKRKRVEDTTDVTLYMSQHNLFSYNENKTSDPDSTFVAEEFSNPVLLSLHAMGHNIIGSSEYSKSKFIRIRYGDFMLPESMFSSYGEGIFVPDIIESTVSVLSSADVTMHQSQIGDSCEDIMDNVIHYQQAELEIKQTTEKHREPEGSGQEERAILLHFRLQNLTFHQ